MFCNFACETKKVDEANEKSIINKQLFLSSFDIF